MKLHIAHAHVDFSWKGPWIYLGKDYLILREWEEKLSGQRQSLSMEIHRAADLIRPDFLAWTERQRTENNDSLHWWMSHLAGRNNMTSMLFLYICQMHAIQAWLRKHGDEFSELLVVCEDIFLLNMAVKNLASDADISDVYGSLRGSGHEWRRFALRIGYNWLFEPVRAWRHWRAAKKSRTGPVAYPEGTVVLMHQCLDDKAFRNDGRLLDRYFTVLPEWIEARGYDVVRLPWLLNVTLPLERIYEYLRNCRCFVKEDYLKWQDYVRAFKNHLLSVKALRKNIAFPGMAIAPLVLQERLQQLADVDLVRFWLYQPALARWSKNIQSLLLIDMYEGMPAEHVQIKTLREVHSHFKSIGYYHVLISRGFLGYHYPAMEWRSSIVPDLIVTNGELGRTTLLRQGAPTERLIAGPALRQQFNIQMEAKKKRESLLILLALDPECCVEVLVKINRYAEWIRTELSVPIRLKTHPMMRREMLLAKMGWQKLPEGWEWVETEIQEALETAHCCITLGTASAYDAIVAGCTVLPLERELGFMGNYLDLLGEDFEIARSVPPDKIQIRLEEIFVTRREHYVNEFAKIRTHLLEGLNPVSDELLNKFLPEV